MEWVQVMEKQIFHLSMESFINNTMFYDLKLSNTNNYSGGYLYENPLDSNYVHDKYLESFGPGFFTGGQEKNHEERTINNINLKFDFNWQVNKNHSIKSGFNITNYSIDNAASDKK